MSNSSAKSICSAHSRPYIGKRLNPIALSALLLGLLQALPTVRAEPIQFEQDVWPILEASCVTCHRPPYMKKGRLKKPKGGLILDSAAAILKGGEDGAVIVPGDPTNSPLYTLTTLDPDDDDVMPSKGDPLTQAQQHILRDWIQEGASFGKWKGNERDAPPEKEHSKFTPKPHPLDILASGLPPLAEQQYKRIPRAHIVPISTSNPLLRVAYIEEPFSVVDRDIAKLSPLRNHVTELDLSETQISDKGLGVLIRFKKLTRLDLHATQIGDQGLVHLKTLPHLRSLNLHSTQVSDQGLRSLSKLPALQALYLWNSQVSDEGCAKLQAALPNTEISCAPQMPYPEVAPTNAPTLDRQPRRRKS